MRDFEKLKIWQRSMKLCTTIYQLTKQFPTEEKFSLISQIKRSSISIPSNIAEGAARSTTKDFINFLHISMGSLNELYTQIKLAEDLEMVSNSKILEPIISEINELKKMLFKFIDTIKKT